MSVVVPIGPAVVPATRSLILCLWIWLMRPDWPFQVNTKLNLPKLRREDSFKLSSRVYLPPRRALASSRSYRPTSTQLCDLGYRHAKGWRPILHIDSTLAMRRLTLSHCIAWPLHRTQHSSLTCLGKAGDKASQRSCRSCVVVRMPRCRFRAYQWRRERELQSSGGVGRWRKSHRKR